MTINVDLKALYESKEYQIDMDTENVIQVYQNKKKQLDEQIGSINDKLKQMKQLLDQIQSQMSNKPNNLAQKSKFDSYVQNVKEIEKEVQNAYQIKLDKVLIFVMQINHDKNQIQIFGKRLTQKLDNIVIQIETGKTLDKSLSSTEESLQIGYEAMASFSRQQNNMRRIQTKMNSLIGDMGLSQGILKLMGGRDKADKRMILILTAILFVYIICLYYAFK
ncbi:hypothetical protein pb186bvf_000174 [Paramecium bursaria]